MGGLGLPADRGDRPRRQALRHRARGRCGPASSPTEVRLSTVVTGLLPNTTYYFRACGQDTNGPRSCAAIVSFTTTMADSTAAVSGGVLTFTATAGAATNVLASWRFTDTDGTSSTGSRISAPISRAAG